MKNRRTGEGPVPSAPELFINKQQVHGLIVLKKFGWNLVCIRRTQEHYSSVILRSKIEREVGILQSDGSLRLSDAIKIRNKEAI